MIPFNHLIRQKQIIVKITEILRKNKKKKNREEKSIDFFKKKRKTDRRIWKTFQPLAQRFQDYHRQLCLHIEEPLYFRENVPRNERANKREKEREREDNSRRLRLGPVTRKILLETSHWDPIKGSSEFEKENQPTRWNMNE